jgi:hypothetical protein
MSERRDKARPLKVLLSPTERRDIEQRAGATGLAPSGYLRSLGLGYQPKSMLDQRLIQDLAKVNADQGRLGGLLKLWLSERPGTGASTVDVRRLLNEIEAVQRRLKAVVERL